MRRTLIVATCLVVSCLVGLALWLCMNRTGHVGQPGSEEAGIQNQASDKLPKNVGKPAEIQTVFKFPVLIAGLNKGQFIPCYYDQANKTLYHWKDVYLTSPAEYGPYRISGRMMVNAKDFIVMQIDPPVRYRRVDGGYQPGYRDWTVQEFYAWKGVVLGKQELLEKSQDGNDALMEPDDFGNVIEIDMPAHLKDHPELWKKS